MPIYNYHCKECKTEWENIEVWKSHKATECPQCNSSNIERILGAPHIRMDPNDAKRNLPDASPPLEELRGKGIQGYKDKPHADTNLHSYTRRRDKQGNVEWHEKRRQYIDMGKHK